MLLSANNIHLFIGSKGYRNMIEQHYFDLFAPYTYRSLSNDQKTILFDENLRALN